MRKIIVLQIVLISLLSSCALRKKTNTATTDVGVVIKFDGVTWATRNVDTSGIFVKNPEDFGKLYTWNEAQSACPIGWRLPTAKEMSGLLNTPNMWKTQNGVNGREVGATPNRLFLPAAGYINSSDSTLSYVSSRAFYWSSSKYESIYAIYLVFGSGVTATDVVFDGNPNDRKSVRCVKE
jgi:uncharacterized protein (TIGR02145 family)